MGWWEDDPSTTTSTLHKVDCGSKYRNDTSTQIVPSSNTCSMTLVNFKWKPIIQKPHVLKRDGRGWRSDSFQAEKLACVSSSTPPHPSTQHSHAYNTPTHNHTTTTAENQYRSISNSNLPAVCMSSMSRSRVDITITHLILKQSEVVLLKYSFKA